jgi:hypothetical protein
MGVMQAARADRHQRIGLTIQLSWRLRVNRRSM